MADKIIAPWPSTVYPSDTYPGGYKGNGRRLSDASGERFNRIMGGGCIEVQVEGVSVFPRTVEHDLTISRGRSSFYGPHEAQALQLRTVGIADPILTTAVRVDIILDIAAVNGHLGWSFLSTNNNTRCARAIVTDLSHAPSPRGENPITSVIATGNMAKLGRVTVPAKTFPPQTASGRFREIVTSANAVDPAYKADQARMSAANINLDALKVDAVKVSDMLSDLGTLTAGEPYETRPGLIAWADEYRPVPDPFVTIPAHYIMPDGEWAQKVENLINAEVITRTVDSDAKTIARTAIQSSIDTFGVYENVRSADGITNDTDAGAIAQNEAGARSVPRWAPPPLVVDMLRLIEDGKTATAFRTSMIEVADLIAISGASANMAAPGWDPDWRVWVEGITEHISNDEWNITLTVSPLPAHRAVI